MKALQGSSAEVYLHGAHLTSWKNNSGQVSSVLFALLLNFDQTAFCCFVCRSKYLSASWLFSNHPKPSGKDMQLFLLAGTNVVLQRTVR